MKILLYTHEFVPYAGGVATRSYELAMGLSELGQDVIVLAPKYSNNDIILDEKMPFKVVRANLSIGSLMQLNRNIVMLPVNTYRFLKVLRHYKPDRILLTEIVAQESAAIARLFLPFRFACTLNGTQIYMHLVGGKLKQWSKAQLMRWFFSKADSIACVSKSTKNLLERNTINLRNKTSVVYNGVDPNKFSRDKGSEILLKGFNLSTQKTILTVARLSLGKGQDIVIKALPKVLEKIPNTKYLIVGEGATRPDLEALVKKMQLGESVLFVGFINNERIGNFYDACDTFIMLSRRGLREGIANVYLEVWVHGKPVIGGDTGATGELIEDGETGILVDPLDVDAAAEALCRLLQNEDLARAMGKAGRKKIEEVFSRKSMAQKILDLL